MPSEARFAERSQQVLERLEAEKIERLVGDLEFHLSVRSVAALAAVLRLIARLFHRDVAFVEQLLHQVVDELVHLLFRHRLQLLHHLLELLVAEKLPVLEGLLDGALQVLERMLVELAEAHVLGVEPALQ